MKDQDQPRRVQSLHQARNGTRDSGHSPRDDREHVIAVKLSNGSLYHVVGERQDGSSVILCQTTMEIVGKDLAAAADAREVAALRMCSRNGCYQAWLKMLQ